MAFAHSHFTQVVHSSCSVLHSYHSTSLWRHPAKPRTSVDYFECMHAEYSLSTQPYKIIFTVIFDVAQSRHVDLFGLTETWITSSAASAELRNATPPGFSLISCPRPAPPKLTSQIV